MDLKELEPLAEQHVRLNTQIKALERLRDQVNDRINAELGDSEEKVELVVGRYKLDRQQITSERVDSRILAERYPSIHKECSKVSTYRRLSVREQAQADAAALQEIADFAARVKADTAAPQSLAAPPLPATPELAPEPHRRNRRRRR